MQSSRVNPERAGLRSQKARCQPRTGHSRMSTRPEGAMRTGRCWLELCGQRSTRHRTCWGIPLDRDATEPYQSHMWAELEKLDTPEWLQRTRTTTARSGHEQHTDRRREEYRRLDNRVTCILQQRWPANEISQWVGMPKGKQQFVACAILRRRHPPHAQRSWPCQHRHRGAGTASEPGTNSPTVPVLTTDGRSVGRRHIVDRLTP